MMIDSKLLLPVIINHLDAGIFVINKAFEVVMWNQYMARHTGKPEEDLLGKNLFEMFPELPQKWLEKKIRSVFLLKNFSFTSWEQRPWLFPFSHNRPITGGVDFMQQNCTFMPLYQEGVNELEFVCVTIVDVTDAAIYQGQLNQALLCLEQSSITDALTQIYNRRFLQKRFGEEFDRVLRKGTPLSSIIFDLDFFKKINDQYGHLGGDEVLKTIASRLKALVRSHDVLGRYGGEEFAVILPDTDEQGAVILAERLRQAIEAEPVVFGEHSIVVTASIGVASFRESFATFEGLIHAADEALYHAKRNGRNQVVVYNDQLKTLA